MLKASALYLVIVFALVIGVLCSSLIVMAYYYKSEYQKNYRYDQLENDLSSGINILLTSSDSAYSRKTDLSLFNNDADSVILHQIPWGLYDVGVVRAHIQKDTLFKVFTIAYLVDSSKWAAIYLLDEDRPMSVSGKTSIVGNAYLPRAGIQPAYIDNHAYQGDKHLVIGKKYTSQKKLPALVIARLGSVYSYFSAAGADFMPKDTLRQSFLQPTKVFDLKRQEQTLTHIYLKGNIILRSDTTITIDSSAVLENVLVFARAIVIKDGFHGHCQLFATDSVFVGKNCHFGYPSALGIIRTKAPKFNSQARVSIGENTVISGSVFTYEKAPSDLKPLVSIGKKDTIKGQIYSQDALDLKDHCVIEGSTFTSRFLYRNTFTLYENYLINVTINSRALSPYYLSSGIMPVVKKEKKILQWLEGN
jgi:hypothetical protein